MFNPLHWSLGVEDVNLIIGIYSYSNKIPINHTFSSAITHLYCNPKHKFPPPLEPVFGSKGGHAPSNKQGVARGKVSSGKQTYHTSTAHARSVRAKLLVLWDCFFDAWSLHGHNKINTVRLNEICLESRSMEGHMHGWEFMHELLLFTCRSVVW